MKIKGDFFFFKEKLHFVFRKGFIIEVIMLCVLNIITSAFCEKIGISYDQVIAGLPGFRRVGKTTTPGGEVMYLERTADGSAVLQIIGDKSNITEVSLIIGFPSDAPDVSIKNLNISIRFVKNLFPECEHKVVNWLNSSLKKVADSPDIVEMENFGKKKIKIECILGMLVITVTHRNECILPEKLFKELVSTFSGVEDWNDVKEKFYPRFEGCAVKGVGYIAQELSEDIQGGKYLVISNEEGIYPYCYKCVSFFVHPKKKSINECRSFKLGDKVHFEGRLTFINTAFAYIEIMDAIITLSNKSTHQVAYESNRIIEGCKIQGILYSPSNPLVLIDGNTHSLNDSVCGGKIVDISPNKITVGFQDKEKDYKIGDFIKKE